MSAPRKVKMTKMKKKQLWNRRKKNTKARMCKTKQKIQKPDTTELEAAIDEQLELHDETKKRSTSEAIRLGKSFNELQERKGLSRNKWVAFFKTRYPHIRNEMRIRYMDLGEWINLKKLPHLQDAFQNTLNVLIDVCKKKSLKPADLPAFLDEHNLIPDYEPGSRDGALRYKTRLRKKLQEIKNDLKDAKPSIIDSPDHLDHPAQDASSLYTYSSFDEIPHLDSPPSSLCDGIYHLEEYFQDTENKAFSESASVFLPQLHELSLDIQKLLKAYNNKHRRTPRLLFDLDR